ncbi:MAG: hypothetical protein NW203_15395 [Hyphomonadaceae bacterium]|nr:hypothetical protein [Hyphomonadaceae bacterium]
MTQRRIWSPIDRDAAKARVRELRARIHEDADARAEWRLLSMLLHKNADAFADVKAWRRTLH